MCRFFARCLHEPPQRSVRGCASSSENEAKPPRREAAREVLCNEEKEALKCARVHHTRTFVLACSLVRLVIIQWNNDYYHYCHRWCCTTKPCSNCTAMVSTTDSTVCIYIYVNAIGNESTDSIRISACSRVSVQ